MEIWGVVVKHALLISFDAYTCQKESLVATDIPMILYNSFVFKLCDNSTQRN